MVGFGGGIPWRCHVQEGGWFWSFQSRLGFVVTLMSVLVAGMTSPGLASLMRNISDRLDHLIVFIPVHAAFTAVQTSVGGCSDRGSLRGWLDTRRCLRRARGSPTLRTRLLNGHFNFVHNVRFFRGFVEIIHSVMTVMMTMTTRMRAAVFLALLFGRGGPFRS